MRYHAIETFAMVTMKISILIVLTFPPMHLVYGDDSYKAGKLTQCLEDAGLQNFMSHTVTADAKELREYCKYTG